MLPHCPALLTFCIVTLPFCLGHTRRLSYFGQINDDDDDDDRLRLVVFPQNIVIFTLRIIIHFQMPNIDHLSKYAVNLFEI